MHTHIPRKTVINEMTAARQKMENPTKIMSERTLMYKDKD